MKKLVRVAVIGIAALAVAVLGLPTNAAASDWGGYADPAWARCGSNSVVKSVPMKDRYGNVGGTAYLKWSKGCPGNYALVVANSYMGSYPSHIAATVKGLWSNQQAGTDEYWVNRAWTRVARVGGSEPACIYTDLWKRGRQFTGVVCAWA